MILIKNSKCLSSLRFCIRDLVFVVWWYCFPKRRLFTRHKCHFTIVKKFAFSKGVNQWFWSNIPNFFRAFFFLQKRPRFCRFMIMFSPNESFWTIKISRYYGRKICIFSKGLTHDSCQKFQLPLETYFSVKETSVFSFDDVVLSKGGFLDNKIVNVRG